MRSSLLVAATFVIGALGHARVLEPAPRKVWDSHAFATNGLVDFGVQSGPVSAAACGTAVTKSLTAGASDDTLSSLLDESH